MSRAEYMREYRARAGGTARTAPADKANSRARAAAARWVRDNHPEVWGNLIVAARSSLGLSTELSPNGNFCQPIRCGEWQGYQTHVRRGEAPCSACRAAKREYDRAARARRAAS